MDSDNSVVCLFFSPLTVEHLGANLESNDENFCNPFEHCVACRAALPEVGQHEDALWSSTPAPTAGPGRRPPPPPSPEQPG